MAQRRTAASALRANPAHAAFLRRSAISRDNLRTSLLTATAMAHMTLGEAGAVFRAMPEELQDAYASVLALHLDNACEALADLESAAINAL